MSKERVRELVKQGDRLFEKRRPILNYWQTVAENFYPERADFTVTRSIEEEFGAHLMTGRPVLARRDLANSFASMLRPRETEWFHCRTDSDEINEDRTCRKVLETWTKQLRLMMYAGDAQFIRATKEGDNDFAAFGQTVIQTSMNRNLNGLLYRNWHLRDCAWCENSELKIDTLHRNWKIEAKELLKLFPKTVSGQVANCVKNNEPYKEIACRHVVMPSEDYEYMTEPGKKRRAAPFVSIVFDCENDTILEEVPQTIFEYTIPRWVTISGSQYAYSPAVVVALHDARMLQQISLTLLEAGQKAVDPPMKATGEVITGGVNMMAGGITWVDPEYDETTGKALEPMTLDTRGLNWGVAWAEKTELLIQEAFFLNKINLPELSGDRTAYEVQKLVEEYIRQALPLFQPMEDEYNRKLCETTFEMAMQRGAFGHPKDWPEQLWNRDLRFQFESPLQAATEKAKSQQFVQTGQLLAQAVQIEMAAKQADSIVALNFDLNTAFRDAIGGTGAPVDWTVDEEKALQAQVQRAQIKQQAEAAQGQMAAQGQIAAQAHAGGQAAQSMMDAQMKAKMAEQAGAV
jgi:hypothetical protein